LRYAFPFSFVPRVADHTLIQIIIEFFVLKTFVTIGSVTGVTP